MTQYDGRGGALPPSYTYSMSFSLASFQLNGNLQLSGSCAIDDDGILAINGNTIEPISGMTGRTAHNFLRQQTPLGSMLARKQYYNDDD